MTGKATRRIMGKISVGIYLSYEATTQQGMDNQQIKAGSLIYCLFFPFPLQL